MEDWRPEDWLNPHISLVNMKPINEEYSAFEAGADSMLEVLRSDPDCRIEVLSSRWADEARHWAASRNLIIVLIPKEKKVT